MSKIAIGIDFGTSNIKVAKWNERKKEATSVKLGKVQRASDNSVPNIIYYAENDKIIGFGAKQRNDLSNRVELIKKKLEVETWNKYFTNIGRDLSAKEIATDIFKWIFNELNSKTNGSEVFETIITVPVCYSEVQKNRIKKCAEEAGFIIDQIIIEPVAALFFDEELFEEDVEETVLVFDFGGGTLDLTIANIENDDEDSIVKVLSSNGIRIGGSDITKLFLDNFKKSKFGQLNPNIDISKFTEEEKLKFEFDLLEKIEECKLNLYSDDEDKVEDFFITNKGDSINIVFTREEAKYWLEEASYNDIILDLLEKSIDDAKIEKEDITKVKFVGGSSRIDYFQNIIYDFFGKNDEILELDDIDDDEIYYSVSSGAVNYINLKEERDLELHNRIAFSIGYGLDNKFESLISKNAKYGYISPKRNLRYSYLDDNKYLKIYQLFEKENGLSIDDEKIVYAGQFDIDTSKYSNKENILFEVQIDKRGDMIGRFYDYDEDIILTETLKLNVGE